MKRCLVLVEGQTEEAFVNQVLAPHLVVHGFSSVQPVVLITKRAAGGEKVGKGGVSTWGKVERDLQPLLRNSHAVVTTMLDLYGLPSDTPGLVGAPPPPRLRATSIEAAISAAFPWAAATFIPYLEVNEFEAMLYCDPSLVATYADLASIDKAMSRDLDDADDDPELINNGPNTAPSKRIARHWPGYRKGTDGPTIAARIGLQALRSRCQHLDEWITQLEQAGHAELP
jgi:Domain of unknown function (DUF4276)